jgi:DNA-binding beta-propeller fold protein YncE
MRGNLLPFALVWLAVSCAGPKLDTPEAVETARPVWPPAPDQPRIRYVRSIATPADLGRSPGGFKRVLSAITGETGERERFSKPFGLTLDEKGNLCLTDMGNNAVYYCDLGRKQWRRWLGAGKRPFGSPVAMGRRDGTFYVADSGLGHLSAFTEDGRESFTISSPLQRPAGLAVTADSLIVADSQAHAIFVFDLRGRMRFRFGRRGTGPGEFNYPTHVATDKEGHVLITDSLNGRVQVFDAAGKFIAQIGTAGDAPGSFGRPKGVAADTFGHIYVVDAMFDNVQIFDLKGRLLLGWGEGGTKPGQFGVPAGIAIGPDNRIYVADSYNRRVQVFEYIGEE